MLEVVVILVFAGMFLGPCVMATRLVEEEEEEGDEIGA